MTSIFPKMEHAGPKEHLMWVKKAKEAVRIPVIASLNAVKPKTWVEYARHLTDQGVDALELNFFATPRDFSTSSTQVEEEQLDAVRSIRQAVSIPLAVKLSMFYSNPLHFICRSWTTRGSTASCSSTACSSRTSTWTPRDHGPSLQLLHPG